MDVVREIVSPDGARKVVIYRREDGTFGFTASHFSSEPLEMSWIPDPGYGPSFTPDADSAEREARG